MALLTLVTMDRGEWACPALLRQVRLGSPEYVKHQSYTGGTARSAYSLPSPVTVQRGQSQSNSVSKGLLRRFRTTSRDDAIQKEKVRD